MLAVAANAGLLGHEYVHHEPAAVYAPAVHKTIQYAAAPIQKHVYESEPIGYHNYHASPVVAKTLEYAPAHIPSYGHSHQAVHHGLGQTVSHYGKVVSSPHSYVKKYDTRIISEEPHHYKLAAAHAYPTIVKTPVHHTAYVKPVVPAIVSSPVVPVVKAHYHHEPHYHHGYDHHDYDHHHYDHHDYDHHHHHSAPVIAHKSIAYSPADVVSHTSFESANAHYAW